MTLDSNDPRLTAYALDELDPSECELVESLLKVSEPARQAVDEIRLTAGWLTTELRQEQEAYLPLPVHDRAPESGKFEEPNPKSEKLPVPSPNHQPLGAAVPKPALATKSWWSRKTLRLGSLAAILLIGVGITRLALAPRGRARLRLSSVAVEKSRAGPGRNFAAREPLAEAASRAMEEAPAPTVVMTEDFRADESLPALPSQPEIVRPSPVPRLLRRRTVVLETAALGRASAGPSGSLPAMLALAERGGEADSSNQEESEAAAAPAEAAAKSPEPNQANQGMGGGMGRGASMMAGGVQPKAQQAPGPRSANQMGLRQAPRDAALGRKESQVPLPVGTPKDAVAAASRRGETVLADQLGAKPATAAAPARRMAKNKVSPAAKEGDKNQNLSQKERSVPAIAQSVAKTPASYEPQQGVAPAVSPFRSVGEAPQSTFLIDVDRASYVSIRRSLSQNTLPPKDEVRIEELLNEFPNHDVAPLRSNPDPLAVHIEIAGCPWEERHRLARIGIAARASDQMARGAVNFVFLIDTSASMREPDRLPLLQWSLNRLVDQLQERDRLAIVAFGGAPGVVLASTSCLEKAKIHAAVDDLKVEAPGTARSALALAYDIASSHLVEHGINRVIVATDASSKVVTLGEDEFMGVVAAKAARGVSLCVLGMGPSVVYDAPIVQLLSKLRGRHVQLVSPVQAYLVLVEETGMALQAVATDAKVQVQLNPDRVSAYRLLGYDSTGAPSGPSIDDSKDAGAILVGHHVSALYEVVPPGALDLAQRTREELREGRGRRLETLTVRLTYKRPEEGQIVVKEQFGFDGVPFAGASDDFKTGAALAGFGRLLRESPVPRSLNYELVQKLIEPYLAEGRDPTGYYHEFAGLVRKAKAISGGGLVH